jgi:hypothetical protein
MKTITNLSRFRPLTAEMIADVKASIERSEMFLGMELNLPKEKRNMAYEQYLNNHMEMLRNELKIAGCKE